MRIVLRGGGKKIVLRQTGRRGPAGAGLPTGGTTGQVPVKQSAADYDIAWETPPTAPVTSVNGQTGAVVLNAGDVGADVAGSAAQALSDANDYTDSAVAGVDTGVMSVVAGDNVTVDNTDPANPIVSAAGTSIINANNHGVVADGVTDDSAAWNALVSSCSPGDVITWTGRSMLYSPIIWKSNLSLIGQGWGKSVLATKDDGTNHTYHAAIKYIEGDGASISNTLDDCVFANFEIDGSELGGTTYTIAAKGLFMVYMKRPKFLNLYIHDTIATGLGCDFLPEGVIDGVVARGCGRLNNGTQGGGAGIGIGMGAWEYEPLVITNCHTANNGHWGIFVEVQENHHETPYGTGAVIIGNTSVDDYIGIGDRGTIGCQITGNFVYNSKQFGISASYAAKEGTISDNHIYETTSDAINLSDRVSNYRVTNNTIVRSGRHGIGFTLFNTPADNISLTDNSITESQNMGINVTGLSGSTANSLFIDRNRIWNNGQKLDNWGQGIYLTGFTASGIRVNNNRIYDDQTIKTQDAALKIDGTASNPTVITDSTIEDNNVVGSASTFGLTGPNITSTNLRVSRNIGYRTENVSTGTIVDGNATVTIPHGLASPPTKVFVSPSSDVNVWPSTIGTNNIIFSRTGTIGDISFTWSAEV